MHKVNDQIKVDFNQSFENQSPVNSLPIDVLVHLFSLFQEKNIYSVVQVNRTWCYSVVTATRVKELNLLQSYLTFLSTNLQEEKYDALREKFTKLKYDTTLLNSITLVSVKKSLGSIKEQIIGLLKDVDIDTLRLLDEKSEEMEKPKLFNDAIYLAIIEKKLEDLRTIPDARTRFYTYSSLIEEICTGEHGELLDKAIGIYNEIDNLIPQDSVLRYIIDPFCISEISKALTIRGKADKALALVPKTTNDGFHLLKICKILIKRGDYEKAIEVAFTISPHENYNPGLRRLARQLLKKGDLDKAIKFAKTVYPEDKILDSILVKIADKFAAKGNINKALEIAKRIKDDEMKEKSLLKFIAKKMAN